MELDNEVKTYFEQQIHSIDVDIDVEKAIMSKIAVPRKRTYNSRILAVAAIIIMSTISTTVIYGQEIIEYVKRDFMNAKGDVEWSIPAEKIIHETYYNEAVEVFDSLDIKEGKAVAIYVKNNNPNNSIVVSQKPITVHDIDLINSYNIGLFNIVLDNEILQKYQFEKGKVSFDMLSVDQGAMIEEANETGKDVIVNDVVVSSEVSSISYDYIDNSKTDNQPDFTVMIVTWYGNELIQVEDEGEVMHVSEKVMIGDSEVLYENFDDTKLIRWISEENLFQITSKQTAMTKEELLQIAEQIKLK